MLKVSLKEELKGLRNSNIDNSETFVNEVKLLMEGTALKERNILKQMGLGSNIIKSELQTGKLLELKALEEKFEGEVYTKDQIKHLAIKYNLKFLNTQHFQGTVAPELGAVLVRFIEKYMISEREVQNQFFILAPQKMFKLVERPVDPLLFYKIPNENTYKLIHKWGNDFSITRRISGMINKSEASNYWYNQVKVVMLFLLVYNFLKYASIFIEQPLWSAFKYTGYGALIFILSVTNIIGLVVLSIFNLVCYGNNGYSGNLSKDKWDSEYNN